MKKIHFSVCVLNSKYCELLKYLSNVNNEKANHIFFTKLYAIKKKL